MTFKAPGTLNGCQKHPQPAGRFKLTQPVIQPFNHDEADKLFQHYKVVDADLDGSISQSEFLS